MTDRPYSRYRADTDVKSNKQTNKLTEVDMLSSEVQSRAAFLSELIQIRDGHLMLSNDCLSKAEVDYIIICISTV